MQKIKQYVIGAVRCVDPVLFICVTALCLISIVTVWGAVDNFGQSKLKMQVAMFLVGSVATVVVASIDFRMFAEKLRIPMMAASILLLIITLIWGRSGVTMVTGNKSWLKLPIVNIMIQPSEFVKFVLVCSFAKHLHDLQGKINHPKSILMLMLHAGSVVALILLSGDLGVALVYLAILAIMLFCAGLHPGYFAGAAGLLALFSPYLWEKLEPYQQRRIIVGFNPELDPLGKGYQPLLSRQAIANGGFFGKGVTGGHYYEILDASHTDFIFATVCEKFGFLGGLAVLILFMVIVVRIFSIARVAMYSDCGGLICVGVGAMFVTQILENIGMNLAMLPVVGITLPFLSCGGSSMLATFLMMGLVHSVYSHSSAVRASVEPELDMDFSLL
ncbi:MAG: hypothetical protein E7620_09140 [Ruminococcaceae bacterium]|nr:hypothetical protein [Oscillospiraceae bacterium]